MPSKLLFGFFWRQVDIACFQRSADIQKEAFQRVYIIQRGCSDKHII